MGLSNYPPGVTGTEPQIAGYREHDANRSCENEHALMIPAYAVADWLDEVQRTLNSARAGIEQADRAKIDAALDGIGREVAALVLLCANRGPDQSIGDGQCPFEGDVTVTTDLCVEWWTCPLCGHEHETSVEP